MTLDQSLAARLESFTAELRQLEKDLKSSRQVAPLIVRDFREAIDNVRLTAWTLQLWLEGESRGHDTSSLLRQLNDERIRRTTQLSRNLVSDLAGASPATQHKGLQELFSAIEALFSFLSRALGRN